ncbi:DUF1365 domain-containing protein [Stappia sp. F7233]|uniref:DUF1365 domain-containing protein n=1 Tax=Stappia albiluteola TaxID=2758565 RepID=A0A839ACQ0_9HYPH|nr:DUF1365 domain-containing protein [Stappia albiluteola]MBA5776439.1 DUF1365 domain-containing protein [Stappia albiluteola]
MNRRLPTTMAANGPPPEEAATLYRGSVMHARLRPFAHRFSYRVFSLLIDLDRLPKTGRLSRMFSVNRFNLVSFHEADHGLRDGRPLRLHVDRLLAAHGVREKVERVLLLCYPRVLGFVFNPLAVYYAYGCDGRLIALIYEVRNTFGDIHTYVEPLRQGQQGPEGIRQARDKAFFVSPFIAMDQRYRFSMLPPGKAVRIRILQGDAGGPLLSATFSGEKMKLTSKALLHLCVTIPLLSLKIVAAIHFEALKIWLKGAPFHSPAERHGYRSSARREGARP